MNNYPGNDTQRCRCALVKADSESPAALSFEGALLRAIDQGWIVLRMDNLDGYLDSCDCTKCVSLRTVAEKLYPPVCLWTGKYSQMVNGVKYWDATCRTGVLVEPRKEWKYCPYCGKRIKVTP